MNLEICVPLRRFLFADGTFKRLVDELVSLHEKHGNWRKVASLSRFEGVSPGTLCSIAKGNYEPKDNEIRKRLKLPIIVIQYKHPVTGKFVKKS